ncbi:B-cell receptor-associated 31-like protein [Artemisia annua]|uniref:Endoplasmic reticulum transmembrane protein n=1 Tax=Artemisia annua TaxID=35608 RepID=A0A2U1NXS4_ARTAN|nr:B-cell receptor-associated 31-like protein [Artemisia annua]
MTPIDQLNNLTTNSLLFAVVITLTITILLLLYNNPFRKQLVIELDQLKTSRAVKLVVTTLIVVTMHIFYGLFDDAVDSASHAYLVLQVSLMGFSLFLLLTIHNVHQYIKEVVMVTDSINTAWKQNQAYEESMKISAKEANLIRTKISCLKTEITKLESRCNIKEQELQSKRADCSALKNQLEGLHAEYDRLLAYSEDVRDQLRNINESISHSSEKEVVSFDEEKDRSEKTGSWPWSRWGL